MKNLYKFLYQKYSKIFSVGIVLVAGRNFLGRICVQHQGGGVKINYKKIDRFRYINQLGNIFRIIKIKFCTGLIGFVFYDNGLCSFILLSEGLIKGSRIFSGPRKVFFDGFSIGSTQKLLHIKLFDTINSFELFPLSGFKVARAAGAYAKIISKDHQKSILKLKSG